MGANGPLTLRQATPADLPRAVAMCAAFHRETGQPRPEAALQRAVAPLLADPGIGLFLFVESARAATAASETVELRGYAVLAFGWSIEFGGRDCYLDEFWLEPDERGRGRGRKVLELLLDRAAAAGCGAMHLEVAAGNARAQALYLQAGFVDRAPYHLFSKRLPTAPD